ncbi:Protein trichome birefringence [Rhynchospora pubera]|uniref:Protein trichome birefringence n=1 Tax=Rhynchospora pubera TaxID=906938 RepID=A0AAV8DD90_9POAL|nr:Protein trichome birefringence [Rhynchospora pubera]
MMAPKLRIAAPTSARRQGLILPLCLSSLLLILLLFFSFRLTPRSPDPAPLVRSASCNYSEGQWVRDTRQIRPRYDQRCKEIFKGWNCIANGKSNGQDLLRWRWQPFACDLPLADPISFLERYRDTNIGFVGDSLNRNMYIALVCMLRRASSEVRKWRPAGADRGITFVRYNLTLAYHRTILLARYGSWSATSDGGALESLGYKQGYRIDVDVPDQKWAKAPNFHHILIFNTGHWWWAPSKFDPVQSPMLFFQNGVPVIPPLSPPQGLDLTLKHMLLYLENWVGPEKIFFFRTQSPRHFEGGDWNTGGSCRREQPLSANQVGELFSVERNGTNVESRLVNHHLSEALQESRFHILDVTSMSEFRADAHPSTTGGKKHEDCMHWCLPGLPDTWNDLFIATLNTLQTK